MLAPFALALLLSDQLEAVVGGEGARVVGQDLPIGPPHPRQLQLRRDRLMNSALIFVKKNGDKGCVD